MRLFLAVAMLLTLLPTNPTAVDPIRFEEASSPGLHFVTNSGKTARKYLPQTMAGGVAVFDYNNDGLLDIFVVNGAAMPGLVKKGGRSGAGL